MIFLNHWNQQVGRCDFMNQPEWNEWNEWNEGWFMKSHRPTRWYQWFRKNHTSLRWDFLLIQGFKPWIIRSDFSVISVWFKVIQGDFKSGVWFHRRENWNHTVVWFHRRENWNHTVVWFHRREIWNHTVVWFHRGEIWNPLSCPSFFMFAKLSDGFFENDKTKF